MAIISLTMTTADHISFDVALHDVLGTDSGHTFDTVLVELDRAEG